MQLILEIIKKDVRLFIGDRIAAVMALLVPIGIATFLAAIMGGSSSGELKPIGIVVADEDGSVVSKQIVAALQAETHLIVTVTSSDEAQRLAKEGRTASSYVIPKGFGAESVASIQGQGKKPTLMAYLDPSQNMTAMASRGFVLKAAANATLSSAMGSRNSNEDFAPFELKSTSMGTKKNDDSAASRAHVYAGMAVQGVLFYAINLAMHILRDRRLGIGKRIRSAPVGFGAIAMGKVGSGALIGFVTLLLIFASGMITMGVRVGGNPIGFVIHCLCTATFAATFGLLIASLGKTEEQSRGLSIFVVLMLSMLGGAWFPSFLMPEWMQKVTLVIPSRWAIDGFDAALWRGADLAHILSFSAVTLGFAGACFVVATARLKALERQS